MSRVQIPPAPFYSFLGDVMQELKPGVDFVGVGIGVVVRNEKGEMLFGLRTENCRNEPGKWSAPGGSLEFGETLEQCCVREVKEEVNLDVEIVRLLKVIDHFIPGEKQHWVNPLFEARVVGGEAKIMEKNKFAKLAWFSLDNLPENLTVNWAEFFKGVKEGKIKFE